MVRGAALGDQVFGYVLRFDWLSEGRVVDLVGPW